jgi:GNAT superfamily N-acetyltransferase
VTRGVEHAQPSHFTPGAISLSVETRALEGGHIVRYVLGGEKASRLYVRDCRMRVGRAVLRMGGIANVETKEHHRHRGFARRLLEQALVLMRQQEYDVSVLFGISDFYERWGYAPIFPETRLTIAARDAARVPSAYQLRRLSGGEMPLTLELYRRSNALRSGTLVRRRDKWPGFVQGSRWKRAVNVYGAFDANKRLAGYAVLDRSSDEAVMVEVGYRRADVFGALLAAGVRQARRVMAEQVHVLLPADHPFAQWCHQFGCQVVTHYQRSGGAMGRIVGLRSCLARLAPELGRRLRAAGGAPPAGVDWCGGLAIATDIGSVILRLGPQVVTAEEAADAAAPPDACLDIKQALLTQLIFGYRSAADVLGSGGAALRGAPPQVIDALFPPGSAAGGGQAYIWRPDYF